MVILPGDFCIRQKAVIVKVRNDFLKQSAPVSTGAFSIKKFPTTTSEETSKMDA